MSLICPHCGFRENPINAKFCGKCGGEVIVTQLNTEQSKALSDIMRSLKNAKTISRNDPCPCGSGKRYKNCHGRNH